MELAGSAHRVQCAAGLGLLSSALSTMQAVSLMLIQSSSSKTLPRVRQAESLLPGRRAPQVLSSWVCRFASCFGYDEVQGR